MPTDVDCAGWPDDVLALADSLGIESYRQGGIGSWYDAMIPGSWPIPLEEISTRVHLWQGEEDISVPPAMGRYLADRIPDCEATSIQGAGHFWIFEHMPEMLETLVDSGRREGTTST